MLSRVQAVTLMEGHLAGTPKYAHSLAVGEMLGLLAPALDSDPEVWAATGICHDIDIFEIKENWAIHGLRSAEILDGRLPEEAAEAIRAHDHRTGVAPVTPLAHALIIADISIIELEREPQAADVLDGEAFARRLLAGRRADAIREHLGKLCISPEVVAAAALEAFRTVRTQAT